MIPQMVLPLGSNDLARVSDVDWGKEEVRRWPDWPALLRFEPSQGVGVRRVTVGK